MVSGVGAVGCMAIEENEVPEAGDFDDGNADRSRIGIRLAAGFTVKVLTCVSKMYEGDPVTGLVSLAIIYANNAHLDRHMNRPPRYAAVATPPPMGERRPVSVMAVARMLEIPVETARRHVKRLLDKGYFVRVKGGIVVTQMPINEQHAEDLREVYVLLRRFGRQLEWAGVLTQV